MKRPILFTTNRIFVRVYIGEFDTRKILFHS